MRIFKGLAFSKWAKELGISDDTLTSSIKEIENGVYEANLGGNVYKKRISIGNKGKSGGVRTILAFKVNDKAFFIYGFSKSKQANVSPTDLKALKKLAKTYLNLMDIDLEKAIDEGKLVKVR